MTHTIEHGGRRPMHRSGLLLLLAASILTLGAAGDGDDLDSNRRLLDRWRGDPEHYARLRRDLHAFYALPPERQEQLRRFDRDLHSGDLTGQTRLWAVLDRYAAWLEALPEEKRRQVDEAATADDRLQVLRRLRAEEWLARLPEKLRGEVLHLPAEARAARVLELRRQERRQRQLWYKTNQPREETVLRPTRLSDLPIEVQRFLDTALVSRLTPEERDRLRKAEGRWPELLRVVRDLAEAHPVLPPLPTGPVTRWQDLSVSVASRLRAAEKQHGKTLQKLVGRWPEFALEVTRLLRDEGAAPPPLGASRPAELPAEVQTFVQERLLPALAPRQREGLQALEGKWPDYPLHLLRLAGEKGLVVPILGLPGPPAMWEAGRAALPEVPDRLLYRFARDELTPQDRAAMALSPDDPMGSREKVKKAWYRKKMDEQRQGTKSADDR